MQEKWMAVGMSTTKHYSLYEHQKNAVKHLLYRGSGALFMEVGTGKTLTALTAFKELKGDSDLKLLVVCPISLINTAWGDDIRKFTDFKYQSLRDGFKEADIYLINFESYYLPKIQKIIDTIQNKMLVIDESQKLKNHKSKITKAMLKDRTNYLNRIVMTGTPAPNTETEYWAQMKMVCDVLPDSFYAFRNIYFELQKNGASYWGDSRSKGGLQKAFMMGFKYGLSPKKRELLFSKINPYIFTAKKEDCLDLPPQVDEVREVTLSSSQMKIYKEMKNHMITEIHGSQVVARVALTKLMKLRQITAGFAYDEHGEPQDLQDNAKINELMNVLDELGDKQAIIWIQFHKEVDMISERIKNFTTLYAKTKDKDQSIKDFQEGRAKYLIAHPKSAGHGLTLVNCSHSIYFSQDYSFEGFEQSRGRIHRPGQTQKCTYIYLVAKNTIDEDIVKAIKHKESLQVLYDRIANSKKDSNIFKE